MALDRRLGWNEGERLQSIAPRLIKGNKRGLGEVGIQLEGAEGCAKRCTHLAGQAGVEEGERTPHDR